MRLGRKHIAGALNKMSFYVQLESIQAAGTPSVEGKLALRMLAAV